MRLKTAFCVTCALLEKAAYPPERTNGSSVRAGFNWIVELRGLKNVFGLRHI